MIKIATKEQRIAARLMNKFRCEHCQYYCRYWGKKTHEVDGLCGVDHIIVTETHSCGFFVLRTQSPGVKDPQNNAYSQ